MSKHSEKAMDLFKQGYNCAQSVVGAFCDEIDIDFQTSVKLASSFGAGMGRLREVCGAVSGMFIIAGLKYGYLDCDDKQKITEHYELIQALADKFKQGNGTIICRELLGLQTKIDIPVPSDRTDEYYKTRPCVELVGSAAEILDGIIDESQFKPSHNK